jgi:MoaA/NifB/PqqE/SkfB family radical SAM enzyme
MMGSLPILLIEAHSRCNCRCVMCDIWKTQRHREFTREQLEEQLPAIERLNVRWVVFTGGEPLMHSDLFALAAPLRERGIRVSLLSTGLLFERFAARIAAHCDDAIVSIDGSPAIHDAIRRAPGGFAQIARGIAAIRRERARFPITARCVVQKSNHAALGATAAAARDIGIDSISYLAADLGCTAFNHTAPWDTSCVALSIQELPALEREIETLTGDPFVADTGPHLRRIVRHFRAHLGLEAPEAPRCNAPWVSAVLTIEGAVKPCFFQPPIGSGPLDGAVNSPQARRFRETLNIATDPVCRRCVCSLYAEPSGAQQGSLNVRSARPA